jgi:catechol 2,3-dioxygenase-like lactoylglutathione lyase family enzyme
MRLRQVALIAGTLEPAVEDLCAVLGLEVGFRDPGIRDFGLHNAVMPVGDTFLEVVSPLGADTAGGRYLERHGGDWGYMVLLQCDDLDADRARVERLGVRVVWKMDLPDIRGTHLHPRDVGGAILSLDAAVPPESWRWAGPDWRAKVRKDVVSEISGVDMQAADPAAVARRWAEVLARPCSEVRPGRFEIPLDRGVLGFVADEDGRGEGVCAFGVRVRDRQALETSARARGIEVRGDEVRVCGTRIKLEAA